MDIMIAIAALATGLGAHVSKNWLDARKEVPDLELWEYLSSRPARLSLAGFSAAGAAIVFWHYGELTPPVAFAAGFMCDSIARTITDRANI